MTRWFLLGVLAACSGPSKETSRPVQQTLTIPDAAGPDPAARARCEERCDRVVMSRHDACGRNGSFPDWCASDNERMRENCEMSCEDDGR